MAMTEHNRTVLIVPRLPGLASTAWEGMQHEQGCTFSVGSHPGLDGDGGGGIVAGG
jgi:hypothetical protein